MSGEGRQALRTSYLVASVAGVAFFVLSVVLLGWWPRQVLDAQTRRMGPEFVLRLSPSAERGRAIYAREGCAYCHTQQIRYLHRHGALRRADAGLGDAARLPAHVGHPAGRTRPRRAGGTRREDWHFQHLFAPRSVVSDSVMPAYPSLFDGAPDRPRQEARDLVAYRRTPGRQRELGGPEGERRAREACDCPDDEMALMAFDGALNNHPARPRRDAEAPPLPAGDLARGQAIYARRCATCHGADGRGDGAGAEGLRPRPATLAEHELCASGWRRRCGTAWRARPCRRGATSLRDLADVATAVRRWRRPALTPASRPHAGDRRAHLPRQLRAVPRRRGRRPRHGGIDAGHGAGQLHPPAADAGARAGGAQERHRGLTMAPWTTRLSDAELVAVAHYVRGFYVPTAPVTERR